MILVDRLICYKTGLWCHMVSTSSIEELHQFAALIHVRRHQYHSRRHKHYDLRLLQRDRAVEHGAVQVTARELLTRNCGRYRREMK